MTPIHTPLASPAMRKMLVGLVIAFGLLTGCQDRELALSMLNVKPLDPISCEPIATEDVFQTDGVVDLVVRDDYSINLTVRNNLDDIVQSKGFQRADSRLSVNGVVLRAKANLGSQREAGTSLTMARALTTSPCGSPTKFWSLPMARPRKIPYRYRWSKLPRSLFGTNQRLFPPRWQMRSFASTP